MSHPIVKRLIIIFVHLTAPSTPRLHFGVLKGFSNILIDFSTSQDVIGMFKYALRHDIKIKERIRKGNKRKEQRTGYAKKKT